MQKIKILTIMMILLLSFSVTAQHSIYTTESVMFSECDSNLNWSSWKDYSIIEVDIEYKEGINAYVVYTKEVQIYTIIKEYDTITDPFGAFVTKVECFDVNGDPCILKIVKLKNNGMIFHIQFIDLAVMYNMREKQIGIK